MTYLGEILLSIHEDKIPIAGAFAWGSCCLFLRLYVRANACVQPWWIMLNGLVGSPGDSGSNTSTTHPSSGHTNGLPSLCVSDFHCYCFQMAHASHSGVLQGASSINKNRVFVLLVQYQRCCLTVSNSMPVLGLREKQIAFGETHCHFPLQQDCPTGPIQYL